MGEKSGVRLIYKRVRLWGMGRVKSLLDGGWFGTFEGRRLRGGVLGRVDGAYEKKKGNHINSVSVRVERVETRGINKTKEESSVETPPFI